MGLTRTFFYFFRISFEKLVNLILSDRYVCWYVVLCGDELKSDLEELASMVSSTKNICFFTGAGISTESGIPDFRSPGGLWSKYKIIEFQEFLNHEESRLEDWRRRFEMAEMFQKSEPNAAHDWIAEMVKSDSALGVITQNIDDLHQRSVLNAEKLVTFHGTGSHATCLECGRIYSLKEMQRAIDLFSMAPRCNCGGWIKGAVISFGQSIPQSHITRAGDMIKAADMVIAIGSSLVVWPAAGFIDFAYRSGCRLVIINKTQTGFDDKADLIIRANAGEVAAQLIKDKRQ